tara:strand:+ start:1776 stop:2759 length:984 start_codon:yes stop_codon:yes gene_type:complete
MNLNHINFFSCYFDDGDGEPNKDFYTERKFLGGWTVSDRHPIKGLKRHAPSESLPSEDIFDISIDDLRMILEDVICNYATDKNVIFLSGGKDSTALAHAFKQLDIPFTPVSLCSKVSTTSELDVVKQIEAELDINVKYFNIDTIPEKNFKYWIENPYTAKVMAVRELGLEKHQLFTGEIGTGEMQINQALQYTAMMGYIPKALSRWHVNVCGSYRRNNSVLDASIDPIYAECVKHFEKRFKEWDKHPDILNRVMFARLQDEGAYRLFNYGIDDLQWVHPFAQDEFIYACVNMPSIYKGNKSLYKLMYPSLTEIPWRYPKSGLGIPTM